MAEHNLTSNSLQRTQSPTAKRIDAKTISRAKLGDIDAFTDIVEAYYARCLRFARAVLRSGDDAEDVVQDTFIRLYRALPRYEERLRFEAWLFQILGNCCRTANTAHQRERSRSTEDVAALERMPSGERADERLDAEWSASVRRALAQVPEYNREIFLLHHIEGFAYEEIERITGLKRSALKMRVKRAADLLRSLLESRRDER